MLCLTWGGCKGDHWGQFNWGWTRRWILRPSFGMIGWTWMFWACLFIAEGDTCHVGGRRVGDKGTSLLIFIWVFLKTIWVGLSPSPGKPQTKNPCKFSLKSVPFQWVSCLFYILSEARPPGPASPVLAGRPASWLGSEFCKASCLPISSCQLLIRISFV